MEQHFYVEKMHEARMRNLENEVKRNFLLIHARGQQAGIFKQIGERTGALIVVIRKRLKGKLTSTNVKLSEKTDAAV